jgi:hypothetical protein
MVGQMPSLTLLMAEYTWLVYSRNSTATIIGGNQGHTLMDRGLSLDWETMSRGVLS